MTRRKIADRPLIPAAAMPAMTDRRYFVVDRDPAINISDDFKKWITVGDPRPRH